MLAVVLHLWDRTRARGANRHSWALRAGRAARHRRPGRSPNGLRSTRIYAIIPARGTRPRGRGRASARPRRSRPRRTPSRWASRLPRSAAGRVAPPPAGGLALGRAL